MRPKERRETGEQDLFRSRLDQIIDAEHAPVKAESPAVCCSPRRTNIHLAKVVDLRRDKTLSWV